MEIKIFKGKWDGNISEKKEAISYRLRGHSIFQKKMIQESNIKAYPTKLYQG